MKLVLIILFVAVAFGCNAQARKDSVMDRRISVDVKDVSLHTALDRIGNTASVSFIYSGSLKMDSTVSLKAVDKKLKDLLNELLKPLELDYEIRKNKIVIVKLVKK